MNKIQTDSDADPYIAVNKVTLLNRHQKRQIEILNNMAIMQNKTNILWFLSHEAILKTGIIDKS